MLGTKLSDRYEILRELGRGGMGVVYLARDPMLDRDVAIKVISPSMLTEEVEQRFTREARVVAKMDHPSIVGVYDLGRHAGHLFFVMPFVEGSTLRAVLEAKEGMRLGDVVDVGTQVAEALDYSHGLGIVHRDIKPENMLVLRQPSGAIRVRVTDFGLAFSSREHRITRTGALMGTVSYLSPEQVAGQPIDGRSDLYALGTVLYECLVGAPPFVGDLHAVLYRITHEIAPALRSIMPGVDEELEAVVMRCLEKDPARRPQHGKEIADALTRLRARLGAELGATMMVERSQRSHVHAQSPFVGRVKELAEIQGRLHAAVAGECQFVLVHGEPGIGKSRVLDELEQLTAARRIRTLRGTFAEVHQAFPYHGFYEILLAHFQTARSDTSSPPADVSDLAPELLALFPALSDVELVRRASAGAAPSRASASGSPEGDRTYLFDLLARTVTRIGGGKPLVLLLEDLHAGTASVEALQYLVLRFATTPTLVVGTYTDTDVDKAHPVARLVEAFQGNRRFARVALSRFSAQEHRSFVESLLGGSKLDDALVERLFKAGEGNPFVTKEILRGLTDAGSVTRDGSGSFVLAANLDELPEALPATLQEAVEKRLDRLAAEPRRILSIASVLGRSFDARDLEALADDAADLDGSLEALVRAGFLEEERASRGDRLAFTSGVVCDALYAAIPRRRKRAHHLKVAEAIEKRQKGRLDRVQAQLLHHFARADVPEKVIDYGLKQARSALSAGSADDAIRAARTVLTFLEDEGGANPALEAETRTLLSKAHRARGELDAALKELERVIALAPAEPGPAAGRAGALVEAAEMAWEARRIQDAKRWIDKGLGAARAAADKASLERLLVLAIAVANLRGERDLARSLQSELSAQAGLANTTALDVPPGGTLVTAFAAPARAAEPAEIRLKLEDEILSNVFETLLSSDAHGALTGNLCTHWEAVDGGAAFVFTLRTGVKMHDGHPLVAADAKASLERLARLWAPAVPPALEPVKGARELAAGTAGEITGITALSDSEIRIELLERLPFFPCLLTNPDTAVARVAESLGPLVVGSGPFRLEAKDFRRYHLVRNDSWHRAPARLDAIEMRVGVPVAEIAADLRNGKLDVAGDLTPSDLDELVRDRRLSLGLLESHTKNVSFAVFNTHQPKLPFAVRAALLGVIRPREGDRRRPALHY